MLPYILYAHRNGYDMYYIESQDNGISWTQPKVLYDNTDPTMVTLRSKLSKNMFLEVVNSKGLGVMVSEDNGKSFKEPISADTKHTDIYGANRGLAVCGTSASPFLVTLSPTYERPTDFYVYYLEYAYWNLKEMKPISRPHPFTVSSLPRSTIDCSVDTKKSEVNIVAFSSYETSRDTWRLAFALDTEPIHSSEPFAN